MTTRDPRLALLSGAARSLAKELGYEMGEKLMIHFGGMQLQVPLKPRRRHALWQQLGEDAARTMCRLYGGQQIEVPIGASLKAAQRCRAIVEHPGSHNQAARAFGVTRRWVRMVRRAGKSPGPLFD
jgi:hypothetical protein